MDKRANVYSSKPTSQVPGRVMGGHVLLKDIKDNASDSDFVMAIEPYSCSVVSTIVGWGRRISPSSKEHYSRLAVMPVHQAAQIFVPAD